MVVIFGCGEKEASTIIQESEPVVVVGSQWYAHAPIWIGIERRIFEKYGFSVSWRFVSSSEDRISKITFGEADFASVGEIAMLTAMAQGGYDFYWVGSQMNAPGFEGIIVRSDVDEIKDLEGKIIGLPFNSSVELTCRLLLRAGDLDPDEDVKLYDLDSDSIRNAFRAGKIHAAAVWEPTLSQLQKSEGARIIGKDTDTVIYDRFQKMTGPDVLIMRKDWVDADGKRARAFIEAYFESVEWLATHVDQAAAIAHRNYVIEDLETIRQNFERIEWYQMQDQLSVVAGEAGLFEQANTVVDILIAERKIYEKPDFRRWAYLDLYATGSGDH